MSKAELRVFIASPGGLDEERAAVEQVAGTLNANLSDRLNVMIVVRKFEQRAARGGRPQGQINSWVDDCDVLIAVVHRRWGSPSGEGDHTGFSEEFERAIERFEGTGHPVVSLHFKAVDAEAEADPGPQLKQVIHFRQRIEREHVALYQQFESLDNFKLNIYQLLVEEMHLLSDSGNDSADESTIGTSAANGAPVHAEARTLDDQSGIVQVLETFAEVIRDGDSDNMPDLDRLMLFATAVARTLNPPECTSLTASSNAAIRTRSPCGNLRRGSGPTSLIMDGRPTPTRALCHSRSQ